jgi:hypothetical protein
MTKIPVGKCPQQTGVTGKLKHDALTRIGEIGVKVGD